MPGGTREGFKGAAGSRSITKLRLVEAAAVLNCFSSSMMYLCVKGGV